MRRQTERKKRKSKEWVSERTHFRCWSVSMFGLSVIDLTSVDIRFHRLFLHFHRERVSEWVKDETSWGYFLFNIRVNSTDLKKKKRVKITDGSEWKVKKEKGQSQMDAGPLYINVCVCVCVCDSFRVSSSVQSGLEWVTGCKVADRSNETAVGLCPAQKWRDDTWCECVQMMAIFVRSICPPLPLPPSLPNCAVRVSRNSPGPLLTKCTLIVTSLTDGIKRKKRFCSLLCSFWCPRHEAVSPHKIKEPSKKRGREGVSFWEK